MENKEKQTGVLFALSAIIFLAIPLCFMVLRKDGWMSVSYFVPDSSVRLSAEKLCLMALQYLGTGVVLYSALTCRFAGFLEVTLPFIVARAIDFNLYNHSTDIFKSISKSSANMQSSQFQTMGVLLAVLLVYSMLMKSHLLTYLLFYLFSKGLLSQGAPKATVYFVVSIIGCIGSFLKLWATLSSIHMKYFAYSQLVMDGSRLLLYYGCIAAVYLVMTRWSGQRGAGSRRYRKSKLQAET